MLQRTKPTFLIANTNQPSRTKTLTMYLAYPDMDDIHVEEEDVKKLLHRTSPRKATGPDYIPARVMKDCASELAPILTIIFNKSLQEGTVPNDWRHANVMAIFKKGTSHDAASYRPVSL